MAGDPPHGACRVPQKLAGGWPETQSGQPSSRGCPAVQTALRFRPPHHSPSYRCAAVCATKQLKPEQHLVVIEHGLLHAKIKSSANPMERMRSCLKCSVSGLTACSCVSNIARSYECVTSALFWCTWQLQVPRDSAKVVTAKWG